VEGGREGVIAAASRSVSCVWIGKPFCRSTRLSHVLMLGCVLARVGDAGDVSAVTTQRNSQFTLRAGARVCKESRPGRTKSVQSPASVAR
jgi:hypothetical protein